MCVDRRHPAPRPAVKGGSPPLKDHTRILAVLAAGPRGSTGRSAEPFHVVEVSRWISVATARARGPLGARHHSAPVVPGERKRPPIAGGRRPRIATPETPSKLHERGERPFRTEWAAARLGAGGTHRGRDQPADPLGSSRHDARIRVIRGRRLRCSQGSCGSTGRPVAPPTTERPDRAGARWPEQAPCDGLRFQFHLMVVSRLRAGSPERPSGLCRLAPAVRRPMRPRTRPLRPR
jgi:hypothetical protein